MGASKRRYLLCLRNDGYDLALTPRKVYVALPDSKASKHKLVRVIDESGEDYLFPASYFVPVRVAESGRALFDLPS